MEAFLVHANAKIRTTCRQLIIKSERMPKNYSKIFAQPGTSDLHSLYIKVLQPNRRSNSFFKFTDDANLIVHHLGRHPNSELRLVVGGNVPYSGQLGLHTLQQREFQAHALKTRTVFQDSSEDKTCGSEIFFF